MEIFQRNLTALQKVNSTLADKINSIRTNERYEIFQGKTLKDINILDTTTKEFLYKTPKQDNNEILNLIKDKKEYPFLYLFGIGNGFIVSKLLENEKHERIVVFEPEIELIYIVLHFFDFSSFLTSIKLVILTTEQLTFNLVIDMLGKDKSRFYAKVYDLQLYLPYYGNHFSEEIKTVNKLMIKGFHHVVSVYGNDVTDTLTGFKHHINNLKEMLNGYKFSELIKKKNSEIAIIVSTGPSLQKQLEKLKSIQNRATIISVDASLPILEKHNIKPDIVTSIERVPATANFFKKTSKQFQKDIIFLCASLQHKETLDAIKGKKVLAMRPFNYNKYFKLDDFGYIGSGMSSANMAHELAIKMGYDTCVLIGQDLAFAPDGKSHSKNHIFGEDDVKQSQSTNQLKTETYGGKGEVNTTNAWLLFKNYFEQAVEQTKENTVTINATEGGARIEGTIELPFEKVIEEYIQMTTNKKKIKLTKPNIKNTNMQIRKTKKILKYLIKNGEKLQNEFEKSFLIIFEASKTMENKSKENMLKTWSIPETAYYINTIEKIREIVQNDDTINSFFYDVIQSDLLHYELELAKVKVMQVSNQKENQEKAIKWILGHRMWLFTLAGALKNAIKILKTGNKKL